LEREEIAVSLKKSVESLQVGGFSVVSLNASDLLAFCVEQEKGGEIEDRVTSCDLLSLGCIKVEADTDGTLEKRQSGGCIEDFAVELVAGGTPRRRDLHKKRETIRSVALCKGEIALYPSDGMGVHRRWPTPKKKCTEKNQPMVGAYGIRSRETDVAVAVRFGVLVKNGGLEQHALSFGCAAR
jgi:hypothetical protein